MQGERGLLHHRLNAYEFGPRLLDRQPDGARVRGIGLVTAHERAHGLGMDQPHGMTLHRQLTRPMVRSAAGFDADQARHTVGEVPQHLGPLELHIDDLACAHVHRVQLEHILGDVQPNDLQPAHLADDLPRALRNTTMHDRTSLVFVKTLVYHDAMGTLMPYPVAGPACLAGKPHAHNGRAVHLGTPGGVCAARRQGGIHYISW